MGDLIEPAFRRAQEKAFLARRVDGLEATYDRALITAYLDDPDVEEAIAGFFPSPTGGQQVLQAIGAKGAE